MNNKLKIIIVLLILFIIISVGGFFMINWYVKNVAKNKIYEDYASINGYDAILILGCQVRADGSLSDMLKDRLDKGIELYKNKCASKVIVSGDHGTKEYDEVNAMKRYMIENGVKSEDIFMDHAGFSTYDSMYRAKEIFKVNNVIVVTQEYHLYRAVYIGNKLSMKTIGVPSVKTVYAGQKSRDLREILARDKDFFKCIFKSKPTYLGETIPVSGNGDITNDK